MAIFFFPFCKIPLEEIFLLNLHFDTPNRQQSKTLLTIDEYGSKSFRNSVFYCYLSPIRRQIAIKNSVSSYI